MRIKNGVLLAIAFILIIGSTITLSTKYVLGLKDKSGKSSAISKVQEDSDIEDIGSLEKGSLNVGDMRTDASQEESSLNSGSASPRNAGVFSETFSLEAEETEELKTTAFVVGEKDAYINKLEDLEKQIQKMWDEDIESTTFAMKNMAEYELSAWDKELNSVYKLLKEKLSSEEFENLRGGELQWIQIRDMEAAKSAKQYEGGTMEGLEFTMTSAALTKARTYELLEYYFEE